MDLASRLQQLEEILKQAKSMPLSSSALVNREELLEMVTEMRESLPEEIRQARWVVRDREELLGKARRDAEQMVEKARDEQLRVASEQEVVKRADDEAERILSEAREEARRMKLESDDYVDSRLAQFEIALERLDENLQRIQKAVERTGGQVQQGRESLRGPSHPAEALAPGELAYGDITDGDLGSLDRDPLFDGSVEDE